MGVRLGRALHTKLSIVYSLPVSVENRVAIGLSSGERIKSLGLALSVALESRWLSVVLIDGVDIASAR